MKVYVLQLIWSKVRRYINLSPKENGQELLRTKLFVISPNPLVVYLLRKAYINEEVLNAFVEQMYITEHISS